jgi:agmatinase
MQKFDPNAASTEDSGIFGLPFDETQSQLIYVPVPWEVTTSYGGGTSQGPQAILNASKQVDLFDLDVLRPYEAGLFIRSESAEILALNQTGKELAQTIIQSQERLSEDVSLQATLKKVNELGDKLNQFVYQETKSILDQRKFAAILGGDHSVPFGALQAVAEKYPNFGVLHFDAHSDTRKAYEGFQWSHASIMYNVLENIPQMSRLIQVGIRDVCQEEVDYTQNQGQRVSTFFDRDLAHLKFEGENWSKIAQKIIQNLPENVWVSFDIDGLDPRFCPHTGTPVPGGLDFHEANHILSALVRSGRKIIGFDLNEVAPNLGNPDDEWDANVGARLLYKLSAWLLASQKIAQIR